MENKKESYTYQQESKKESNTYQPVSKKQLFAFQPENYRLLLIGLGINILGFILMIGGGTSDPQKFDANELFSSVRITLSPALIIAGYVVILYSIMRKKKPTTQENN